MKKKLIFSDLDGTLLNGENTVSKKTAEAIKRVILEGSDFIPVSARMPEAIAPIMESIGVTTPIISYNGALIQDENGEIVFSKTMDAKEAAGICDFVARNLVGVVWNAYSYSTWLVQNKEDYWIKKEEASVSLTSKEGDIQDVSDLPSVHKLLLMGEPKVMDHILPVLKNQFPDLLIYPSAPYLIEVMGGATSKGGAVEYYSAYKDVDLKDTIAFGDNYNDLDMLKVVGQGFVMGNAPEKIKEEIGHVTADNNHDGIAQVLDRLF
ncbi:Cof-type HAD-IIB family hydrolase [Streptococcaceae bacterium ESL0729]|nr:Cof-type HAD-IIB family hydrolase [Streptococcaceae bacterium ESL0729]